MSEPSDNPKGGYTCRRVSTRLMAKAALDIRQSWKDTERESGQELHDQLGPGLASTIPDDGTRPLQPVQIPDNGTSLIYTGRLQIGQ
ncbi:hypothetical protein WOLCODRAFT_27696 [Wolfiporia cocos MD-104 SS10]|uniref:Uncharacterized protein n=1 Tax=Wolfiporia cocos (strain MD-104) TaxID=742152 RepID=A0A2H3J8W2_WOLCO|nr:hypothetical protein WOLCODRAFT_27696 [Wolfiporia cocos MD-104 SS10]